MGSEMDVRVGYFPGDLKDLLGRHSDKFVPFPFGLGEVHKYASVRREGLESYTTMVSNNDLPPPYNMIITVTGPRKERAMEIMEEFTMKTELITDPAPEALVERLEAAKKYLERENEPRDGG